LSYLQDPPNKHFMQRIKYLNQLLLMPILNLNPFKTDYVTCEISHPAYTIRSFVNMPNN